MLPRSTIPICSSNYSPMECQHTARHTEKSSQIGREVAKRDGPI